MKKLVVNYLGREKRYALLNDDKLEKLVIEQPKQQSSVGNIFLGIVTKVLPGMDAAFIDIGEEKNAYLEREKIPAFLLSKESNNLKENQNRTISNFVHQGERMIVQVEKDAAGTKGARVTGIVEIGGRSIVYMPKGNYVAVSRKIEDDEMRETLREFGHKIKTDDEGIIFRTIAGTSSMDSIEAEIEDLREAYKKIVQVAQSMKKAGVLVVKDTFLEQVDHELTKMNSGEMIIDDVNMKQQLESSHSHIHSVLHQKKTNIFNDFQLENEIEKALKRIVWLSNGAFLIFDEAEALTVIDVNTGKYSGKNDRRETVVRTNEWAAEEIVRQIKLRDIGGIILIDFIDMKEHADRDKVLRIMERELKKDEKRSRIIGFTPIGILQVTRKKTKLSISESLSKKCEVCEGTGRVLSPDSTAFQLERQLWEHRYSEHQAVLIETTKEVKDIFCGTSNIHHKRLEETLGLQIYFVMVAAPKPFFEIRQFGTTDEIIKKSTGL